MKLRKIVLAAIATCLLAVTLGSCMLFSPATREVWLHNDTTWTVSSWIVVDRDSYVADSTNFTYWGSDSSSINIIYSGQEKGLRGIPANTNIIPFWKFSQDPDSVYVADGYVKLTANVTYYIYDKTYYRRSADGELEETTGIVLEDENGNVIPLIKLENFSLDGANKIEVEGIEER